MLDVDQDVTEHPYSWESDSTPFLSVATHLNVFVKILSYIYIRNNENSLKTPRVYI